MRIVGGQFARRQLTAPPGNATRPTSDRVREAVFNILQHHEWGIGRDAVAQADVLDVCCGTGALALEAVSRGAKQAWLMDNAIPALKATQANIDALGCGTQCRTLKADALHPPRAMTPCNLIFIDPPYSKDFPARIVPALLRARWIAPEAILVIETGRGETLSLPPVFTPQLQRDYGDTRVGFYVYAPSAPLE